MRRENRNPNKTSSNMSLYITGGIFLIAIAAFVITFVVYSNQLDSDLYALDSEYLSQYNQAVEKDTASASTSIGKTVEESENSLQETNLTAQNATTTNQTTKSSSKKTSTTAKVEKDPTFQKPIEGALLKEFAKDNLIYSETLKEWTTHLGVDIQAERAAVVKAAADGTVKFIKNDPRYGLTIMIEHSNGFESLYANLLTTEFVAEGEKVKAGQTIGTVGDSSIYEITDASHLHFEILQNNENVDPCNYIKF